MAILYYTILYYTILYYTIIHYTGFPELLQRADPAIAHLELLVQPLILLHEGSGAPLLLGQLDLQPFLIIYL